MVGGEGKALILCSACRIHAHTYTHICTHPNTYADTHAHTHAQMHTHIPYACMHTYTWPIRVLQHNAIARHNQWLAHRKRDAYWYSVITRATSAHTIAVHTKKFLDKRQMVGEGE